MKKSLFLFLSSSIALSFVLTTAVVAKTSDSDCHSIYCEAGVKGVWQSPKCPRWGPENGLLASDRPNRLVNCSHSLFNELKRSYGDQAHIFCDANIPLSTYELENSEVGLVTVIYGETGEQNGEIAIRNYVEKYFFTHFYFLWKTNCSSPHRFHRKPDKQGSQILKEAWWRTIEDIDFQLSKKNFTRNPKVQCVGDILLMINDQVSVRSFGCYKEISLPDYPKAEIMPPNWNPYPEFDIAYKIFTRMRNSARQN